MQIFSKSKSLLQTPEWAGFKEKQGWRNFNIEGVYVLEKKLPFGLTFLYSPEVEWNEVQRSQVIASMAKQSNASGIAASPAAPRNDSVIFYRLEILDEYQPEIIDKLKKFGFIKAFEEIQPEWRQIIDISKSEEEILEQMKPKGRYNIKVAQKHNAEVTVCPIDRLVDGVEIFFDLYRQTAQLQKITRRDKEYFLEMLKLLYPKNEAAIIIARYQSIPLAALIVTFYDKTASYLYGGTSRLHKNVMAPYAAHWQAIKLAKEKGCKFYDLLAVSPEDGERKTGNGNQYGKQKSENSNHKYANITRFKEQFGGRKVHLIGSWDLVYKPMWYRMFKTTEKFRRR